MKISYDPQVDVLTIILSNSPVEESDQAKPGIAIDYDENGALVSIEILNASENIENPKAIEYIIAEHSKDVA